VFDQAAGAGKRVGSPVSARIAAAPTTDTPGMLATSSVSPSVSSTPIMRASTLAICARRWARSARANRTRSSAPARWSTTPTRAAVGSVAASNTARTMTEHQRVAPSSARTAAAKSSQPRSVSTPSSPVAAT
jgi:hypothetical protein